MTPEGPALECSSDRQECSHLAVAGDALRGELVARATSAILAAIMRRLADAIDPEGARGS